MVETEESSLTIRITQACRALRIARFSYYYYRRRCRLKDAGKPQERRAPSFGRLFFFGGSSSLPGRASERERAPEVLHSDEFVDKAPHQVYATLLDRGIYLCLVRTMYRILNEHDEVRERRNLCRHPHYWKPELLATAPNQVWSWDITKLKGPAKWVYYYLYVILDIFSRYCVGWMVAYREPV